MTVHRKSVAILCAFIVAWANSARAADPSSRPLVLVHYMPWFEAKPVSQAWGWHWTMNAYNPDRANNGRREIAAHYYPLCEPYDSGDPAVIEYHLLLMKLAGIDGVVVDWYGLEEFLDYAVNHRNTKAVFAQANRLGLHLAVCYEDQTIPKLIEAGRLAAANKVRHARQELAWMRENWFSLPGYLKLHDKPVLLSFGQSGLTDAEWAEVFDSAKDSLVYVSLHHRRSAAEGAFDWPLPKEGLPAVKRFHVDAKTWPISIPVAFHPISRYLFRGQGPLELGPHRRRQGTNVDHDPGARLAERRTCRADRHLERLGRGNRHRAQQ